MTLKRGARKASVALAEKQAGSPASNTRLRRVLLLVPYAVRHPGILVSDLAERFEITAQELLEDLDFLMGVGSPPFAPDDFLDLYVEGERVFVALHQSFTRPPRFTESEAAALAAAARALGGEGAERAVQALRQCVPADRREAFDELSTRIYAGSPPAPESILGRLRRAIADRREVTLRYFTPSRGAESERTVRPYTMAQRFGHWYLYGHDSARGRALPFRIDRVRACELTDTRFDAPPAADLAKAQLFSEVHGEPIQIRIGPQAAAWALSRPGQVKIVSRESDGSAVVEVEGASEDWANRFALSFGGQAQVISPPAARKSFADTVRRSLARYN